MAFLQFDEISCGIELTHEAARVSHSLFLSLTQEKLDELHAALGEVHENEGSELRSEFPAGWTIFWKIREGESRFFLARPEADQWVATLALSRSHFELIRTRIADGAEGALSILEPVSRMSNLEVTLTVRNRNSV